MRALTKKMRRMRIVITPVEKVISVVGGSCAVVEVTGHPGIYLRCRRRWSSMKMGCRRRSRRR